DVKRVAEKYLKQSNRTVGMFIPTNDVARTPIPPNPNLAKLLEEYKGGKEIAKGEAFDPTPDNIEKRIKRHTLPEGLKVVLFPKKTRGEAVIGSLSLHFGSEQSLKGLSTAAEYLGPLMLRGAKQRTREQFEDELDLLASSIKSSSGAGTVGFSWQ